MKILMTTDTIGGVWTYAIDLIRSLGPFGVEFVLASMGQPVSPHQRNQIESLDNVTLHESDYRLEWMKDPWKDVEAAGEWLQRIRAATNPDLIHLNNYAHAGMDWDVPVLVVGHSCVLSWMASVRGTCDDIDQWQRYTQVVRQGLQRADLVLAPTRWMLDQLKTHYGSLKRTGVIANGSDMGSHASLDGRQPFIFSAGRIWDEAKNISLLAEIAEQVEWPIHVAGTTEHPDGYAGISSKNFVFLGTLTRAQMRETMGQAGIFALPAKYEPFGSTPLEAAVQGCPLVLGDIPSLREVWKSSALLLSPSSPDCWVRYLNKLIQERALRARIAMLGRRRARDYSLGRHAIKYREVYRQLLYSPSSTRICTQTRVPAVSIV